MNALLWKSVVGGKGRRDRKVRLFCGGHAWTSRAVASLVAQCGVVVKMKQEGEVVPWNKENSQDYISRSSIRVFLLLPCVICQTRDWRADESVLRVTLKIEEPLGLSGYNLFVRRTAERAVDLLLIFTGFCNYGYWFRQCLAFSMGSFISVEFIHAQRSACAYVFH